MPGPLGLRSEPDRRKPVSSDIINKILECQGLIHISAEKSAKSCWVLFEREYGKRSGREVFEFHPQKRNLIRDQSPALELDLNLVYHASDHERVDRLLRWMADERNFDIESQVIRTRFGGVTGNLIVTMQDLLQLGGVVLWLVGTGSIGAVGRFHSGDFLGYCRQDESFLARNRDLRCPEEDDCEDYDEWADAVADWEEGAGWDRLYDGIYEVFARIDPQLSSSWVPPTGAAVVDLYDRGRIAPRKRNWIQRLGRRLRRSRPLLDVEFNWNRADDLIIEIFCAIGRRETARDRMRKIRNPRGP